MRTVREITNRGENAFAKGIEYRVGRVYRLPSQPRQRQITEAGGVVVVEAETLVRIGGVYHFGCVILHAFFPKLLNWREELAQVSPHNRAVVWILSKLLMYAYAAVGLASIYLTSEILNSRPGTYVLVSISGFWLLRAAFQVKFFSEFNEVLGSTICNVLMLLLWLSAASLYAAPLLSGLV